MNRSDAGGCSLANRVHYALEPIYFAARDFLQPPEKKLIEVGIVRGWHVLDFGCGTGSYTTAAARLVGEEGKVYAADINPVRLERVTRLADRCGLTNIQTILTDCATGLESQTVDAVMMFDVLHCLRQPERVLEEVARVLKPEGALFLSDHHLMEADILSILTAEARFTMALRGVHTYKFVPAGGCK